MEILEKYSNLYKRIKAINIILENKDIINILYDSFKLDLITSKELGELYISSKDKDLLNKIRTQNKIIVKQGKIIDNLKFKIQMMETKLI
jgi:hypothetical protein